ncbi:hypothetical protein C8J57DRAFT_1628382 [Mycena rebaudengoi]|nr:hypothetical protein C8J57DRAFT_1628382 [Mycena rebaudengoi]
MLGRIIAVTLANGALTSALALVRFRLFLGQPDTGVHVGFSWILRKPYTNSVMASFVQDEQRIHARCCLDLRDVVWPWISPAKYPLTVVNISTEQHELQDGPYGWDTTKHATS